MAKLTRLDTREKQVPFKDLKSGDIFYEHAYPDGVIMIKTANEQALVIYNPAFNEEEPDPELDPGCYYLHPEDLICIPIHASIVW